MAEAQNTSRAAVIHAATLDVMRELGVTDRMVEQGIKVPQFRIRDRDSVLMHADFSKLDVATPYALMIPQDESEALLVERLAGLGHGIRRPVKVTAVENRQAGARVLCDGPDGSFAIDCRYVVGADGEKSTVRAAAGINFPGETYGSFLLADVRMTWPIDREEVTLFFSEGGTLVVAPMSKERYRVVAQLPDAPSVPTIADVQRVIDARGPRTGAEVKELLWGSRFQVHHKLAERFRDGPIVLAGDAAHVHSPAGGQGMNLGLRDAVALSAALTAAIRNGDDGALDRYAAERRQAAADVLEMTDRLTKVATFGNPLLRWTRNRVISAAATVPAIRSRVARTLAGVS